MSDAERHLAGELEGLCEDVGLVFFYDAHDAVEVRIFEGDGNGFVDGAFFDAGGGDGFGGGGAVGYDEAAGAEFDATEVADDDDEDVGQVVGVDLAEDGLAGRGGGFAVVVGAEGGAVGAEHVGPADVSGVVVLFAIGVDLSLDFVGGADGQSEGEKAAALLGVVAFGEVADGAVSIVHDGSVGDVGFLFITEGAEVFHDLFDFFDEAWVVDFVADSFVVALDGGQGAEVFAAEDEVRFVGLEALLDHLDGILHFILVDNQ